MKPRKDGDLQLTQLESPTKGQAVRGRKRASGGVFVAVDSNFGAVVGAEEGSIASISSNEGRIAQAWLHARGGLRVFSVCFWHSEGWTPRNEACVRQF